MIPHYLFENGIHPWEGRGQPNGGFVTLTIIVPTLLDLLPIVNGLLSAPGGRCATWFRWHTLREAFIGNAIQKRKLEKSLGSDIGQFSSPVVRVGDPIISSVARLSPPISALELNILSDYRRELLIGAGEPGLTAESVSSMMSPFAGGCDAVALAELLSLKCDLVCCRCFQDLDTHAAFQLFGLELDLRLLEDLICGFGVNRLCSRTEVTELLRK